MYVRCGQAVKRMGRVENRQEIMAAGLVQGYLEHILAHDFLPVPDLRRGGRKDIGSVID